MQALVLKQHKHYYIIIGSNSNSNDTKINNDTNP